MNIIAEGDYKNDRDGRHLETLIHICVIKLWWLAA